MTDELKRSEEEIMRDAHGSSRMVGFVLVYVFVVIILLLLCYLIFFR